MDLAPHILKIIEEEENVLRTVISSLELQRGRGKRRLKVESARAQDFTARIVSAKRDVDKQMLASDEAVSHRLRDMKRDELEGIDKLLDSPYFARIIVEETEEGNKKKQIEFRLGKASNSDCRIIDWRRAPISRLYYEYKEGEEYFEDIQGKERSGTVILRHKVDIKNGELFALTCSHGSFRKKNGSWEAAGGKHRSSSKQHGVLPDVLSLITAEQFQAITQDAESAILIQGVAGSGKTTVALYRLAWLLHQDNSDLQPQDSCILVKSMPLKAYIQNALNPLAIELVPIFSFTEWTGKLLIRLLAQETLTRPTSAFGPGEIRLLTSMAMLAALERYVNEQAKRMRIHLEQELLNRSSQTNLNQLLRKETHAKPIPLLDTLIDECKSEQKSGNSIYEQLSGLRKRMQLYRKDLLQILANPKFILENDETNLLDYELIERTKNKISNNINSTVIDEHEDALLLRLAQLKGELRITEKAGSHGYCLGHIMVDEVQDFSPTELALIIDSVPELHQLTLVGDTAQAIESQSTFPGWDKLREYWRGGKALSHFLSLAVSHRSTYAIMRLADYIQGEKRTKGGRPGKAPLWFRCLSEEGAITEAIGWLTRVTEKFPDALSVVICANSAEANYLLGLLTPSFGHAVRLGADSSFSFEEGILVTSVREVKGLEFSNVLIWNVSAEHYPNTPRARNQLYVAITRAEDNLCLISWDNHSPLMPSADSRLVRAVDEDPPEPEEAEEK